MQLLLDALHSIVKIVLVAEEEGEDFLLMNLAYRVEVARSVYVEAQTCLFLQAVFYWQVCQLLVGMYYHFLKL